MRIASMQRMLHWASEFSLAFRGLWRSKMFSLIAIGSLALGTGANTAIFTLVDQLLLRPMPVREPKELIRLRPPGVYAGQVFGDYTFSYPMYRDLRDGSKTLKGLAASYSSDLNFQLDEASERVSAELVSGNYFEVLGVSAAAGRVIDPSDDLPAQPAAVVVLADGFWKRRFGSDPAIVGRTLRINGQVATVIGIAAPGFQGVQSGRARDVFVPITLRPRLTPELGDLEKRDQYWVRLVGRLGAGVPTEQARAELDALFRPRIEADFLRVALRMREGTKKELAKGLLLEPGARGLPGADRQFRAPLWFLMAVVGLVLLIACVNIANLLLARAAGRQREIAIRRALGARNGDVARQSIAESLLLAAGGGMAGFLLAGWGADLLVGFLPDDTITRALRTQPDWRIAGFAFLLALATSVLFGAAPAWHAVKGDVAPVLGEGSARSVGGGRQARSRKFLVVLQVALSLLLLVGAGLFTRSLANIRNVRPGYRTDHLLQFSLDAASNGYAPDRVRQIYRQIEDRARALPGVESVGYVTNSLLSGDEWQMTVGPEGYERKPGEDMNLIINLASADFFRTVGLPVIDGRDFTERDYDAKPTPVIISASVAKRFWPKQSALGRRISQGGPRDQFNMQVVGVVADHRPVGLRADERGLIYMPAHSNFIGFATFYLRTSQDQQLLAGPIRQEAARIDPALALHSFKTLDRQLDESLYLERLTMLLSSLFAVLATLLAALGLYGVMAYSVAWRTREIGIRMALGAQRGYVLGLVLRDVGLLTVIGLALGVPAALGLSRFLKSELYNLAPTDPLTFVASVGVLAMVAALAGLIPAWRASRVDPLTALRYE